MSTPLADVRLAVRQRADMVNSEFVTDVELNSYIQNSYAELYDLIVSKYEDYYSKKHSFTVDSTGVTTLPSDFYKLRGIDLSRSGSGNDDWITVRKWNFSERNKVDRRRNNLILGTNNIQYRVMGNQVEFLPRTQAQGEYQMWYIPKCPVLSEVVPLEGVNGWEEYVIIDAAIKCLVKEESDTNVLMMQKQQMIERIIRLAANRDAGDPETVADVQDNLDWYEWGRGDF